MRKILIYLCLFVGTANLYPQDTLDSISKVKFGVQIDEMELAFTLGADVVCSDELASLASSGNLAAQNRLGLCYLWGKGVIEDHEKAICWFGKAAQSYNHNALCNLGYCYENGIGVSKNDFQAYAFYKTAALKGHANAASYLARCYLKGIGTQCDTLKARAWFEKCADNGDYVAQNNTGYLYYLAQNYEKAIYWLTKAAEKSGNAAEFLGYIYENGEGIKADQIKSIYYYKKAYSLGNDNVKDKIK